MISDSSHRAPVPFRITLDAQGRIVDGATAVVGRSIYEFLTTPEEAAAVARALAGLPHTPFPRGFVLHWRDAASRQRVLALEARLCERPDGVQVELSGRDLTAHDASLPPNAGAALSHLVPLLDQLPAIVWTVDRDLMITGGYGSGMMGLGLRPGQLIGVSLYTYLGAADDRQPDIERHKRALAGETLTYPSEWLGRSFHTTLSPLRGEQGGIAGAVGVTIDVTDRLNAERQVQRLAEQERELRLEAERLNRMKDDFLINLSHELRTPLAPILGWVDILKTRDLAPEITKALQTIERNARAELRLVEDLLDMSRIVSGKMHLELKRIDLVATAKAAIEVIRLAAEAKQMELTFTADAEPVPIDGDATRLQQALWNLLANALKFTPDRGHIAVAIRCAAPVAVVTVKDDGIGIKPDFLPHLFERFRQADASLTRTYGGLGLGLALVKHIAQSHGGSVSATSPGEGRGATFALTLPLPETTSAKT